MLINKFYYYYCLQMGGQETAEPELDFLEDPEAPSNGVGKLDEHSCV